MNTKKKETIVNFKKAQGSIVQIVKMIENDKYCVDIMQQNLAVIGLLKSAHSKLMEGHLNSCFKTAMGTSNEKRKQGMVEEILKVSKLANK
jgi:DNA-binding FrmR family transcriptional regulator